MIRYPLSTLRAGTRCAARVASRSVSYFIDRALLGGSWPPRAGGGNRICNWTFCDGRYRINPRSRSQTACQDCLGYNLRGALSALSEHVIRHSGDTFLPIRFFCGQESVSDCLRSFPDACVMIPETLNSRTDRFGCVHNEIKRSLRNTCHGAAPIVGVTVTVGIGVTKRVVFDVAVEV